MRVPLDTPRHALPPARSRSATSGKPFYMQLNPIAPHEACWCVCMRACACACACICGRVRVCWRVRVRASCWCVLLAAGPLKPLASRLRRNLLSYNHCVVTACCVVTAPYGRGNDNGVQVCDNAIPAPRHKGMFSGVQVRSARTRACTGTHSHTAQSARCLASSNACLFLQQAPQSASYLRPLDDAIANRISPPGWGGPNGAPAAADTQTACGVATRV